MNMYLGIFVLAACSTFGLVKSDGAPVKPFMCPTCEDCDGNFAYESCPEDEGSDLVCVVMRLDLKGEPSSVSRFCSSRADYNEQITDCKSRKDCDAAMCEESRCVAELPEPFECPVCYAKGKDAQQKCDKKIEYKACKKNDMVCAVMSKGLRFRRGCATKKRYNSYIKRCTPENNCTVAMCEKSRCKAELPIPAEEFQCPVCSSRGDSPQEAEDACDEKIKIEKCEPPTGKKAICDATQYEIGTFVRKCSDMDSYKEAESDCNEYGGCQKAMCTTSGCKAEVPVRIIPSGQEFQCPVCTGRGANAQEDCDKKAKLQTCRPQAGDTPICDLTIYSFGTFVRLCSDMDSYEASVNNCKSYGNCKTAMCMTSGCKAVIQTPASTPKA